MKNRDVIAEWLLMPQRSESAGHVGCFGCWLISKHCVTKNEASLRELMAQYHIEIKATGNEKFIKKAIIPERLRGRVIGALT